MKNLIVFPLILFLFFCICGKSYAQGELQRIEIPSSFNPVGSGARALGMGGAFIAIADDATAASWNPGGLMQIDRTEISIVGAGFHRIEENSFGKHPEADGKETVSRLDLNYLSAAYPFQLMDYNMVFSLNYQHLYDFSRKWNFSIRQEGEYEMAADFQSEGMLSAIGLAYSAQVTENISMGLTFNIWNDDLTKDSWKQKTVLWGSGKDGPDEFVEEVHFYDQYDFKGYNFNLGFLWKNAFNIPLTIGGVIKTPFEADLRHTKTRYVFTQYPYESQEYDYLFAPPPVTENDTLDMPLSYGLGFAYRFSDIFTMSLDFYRTQWDDFILRTPDGEEISPITGKSVEQSNIDPTHQVRLGGEYLGFQTTDYVFPLCFGTFYDPAPAPGTPDNIFGFSVGTGITDRKYFTCDIAYQYRFGKSVGEYIVKDWSFSQEIDEHTLYASFIVYF